MSGLNAIEMSSLPAGKEGSRDGERGGPVGDESARAGCAEGDEYGVAKGTDASRGGAAVEAERASGGAGSTPGGGGAGGCGAAERREDRPRRRRARRECPGELVQVDTSIQEWLEGRGEAMVL